MVFLLTEKPNYQALQVITGWFLGILLSIILQRNKNFDKKFKPSALIVKVT
jgi:hypothetical protein